MKTIESKDLVIGQEYYDIPDTDLENAALLEFVETVNGVDTFIVIAGNTIGYNVNVINNITFFPSHSYYYQP